MPFEMATPQSIASAVAAFAANDREKQLRSVFVGNIPYEATEEKLKEVFSEVGPVVTFRLVFDRETGKPKGYGFCEYKDQETALSAMRNLNACELNGRTLRVDNAASEKSKEEMRLLQEQENFLKQPEIPADQAPEAISKAVASLPPEQMFELMKQMQVCIQNNPVQAKEILLQNSQLAYALLQAQVVMKIVSPETAISMLHKPNKPVNLTPSNPAPINQPTPSQQPVASIASMMPGPPAVSQQPTVKYNQPQIPSMNQPGPAPNMPQRSIQSSPLFPSGGMHDFDQRQQMGDRDMRIPPVGRDPRGMHDNKYDPRVQSRGPPANQYNSRMSAQMPGAGGSFPMGNDPRMVPQMGRSMGMGPRTTGPLPTAPITSQDQEKATLIMQVLQLSPEQIALLPEEQKQSIMVLKEQIARSHQPH